MTSLWACHPDGQLVGGTTGWGLQCEVQQGEKIQEVTLCQPHELEGRPLLMGWSQFLVG